MKKVTLLVIFLLIQICNLDAKGHGFEIQKTHKFEIANFEQHLVANPEGRVSKYDTVQIQTSAVCKMCKERLEHDISFEKGVKSVDLDIDTKVLTVVYRKDKTTDEKLRIAVTKVGYDADNLPAVKKSHDRLPDCCQKDVEPH